ncbi:MAG: crotonase/enoyl-CoA hydratase family protein [Acidimicrobiia bacterium]|nr:crotonase/enoyl-CoA hydratase family protein [Acidimicrobiia bacterium]
MTELSDAVSYDLDGEVAVVHLDDGKANAINHEVVDALTEAIGRAETDAGALVVVGRDGRFSAGFDLSIMTAGPDQAMPLLKAGAELGIRIYTAQVPVLMACTGHALAMGAILLMVADTRIGTAGSFKLGMNEVAIGMPVPAFAVEIARDRLSKNHFVPAIQHAHIYDPDGAVAAGYLDQVAEPGAAEATAVEHARHLATTLRPGAFRMTRQLARGDVAENLRHALARDLETFTVES